MPLEGQQLGHYRLLRPLGSGGMGEVYLAEDPRIGQQVAIKVIRNESALFPDSHSAQEAIRLFEREAKAIARLDHPNILPLYSFGEETINGQQLTYLVMPYRKEGTLKDWLQQRGNVGPLSPAEVAPLLQQAALALQHAHNQHIVHQDIKPTNFLIRGREDQPNRPDLLLADFGIAKMTTATASVSQSVRGTPTYMAPEQWDGNPLPATDQYALAIMVYELLVGRPPFTGGSGQVMRQHYMTPPPAPSTLNPRLSPSIDAVLLRALSKQPEERFASVTAFAQAFQEAPTFPPPVKRPVLPVFERSPLPPVPLPSRDTPLHRARPAFQDKGNQQFTRRENVPLRTSLAQGQTQGATRLSWSWDKKRIASFIVLLAVLLAVIVIPSRLQGSTSSGQPTPSSPTPSSSPTVDVTAVAEYNRYLQATSGAPTFFDPLNNNINGWFVGDVGYAKSYFENKAYHITATPGSIRFNGVTNSSINSLSDFAFQLQITFVQGQGGAGGIVFRGTPMKGYVFYISQDGTYTIYQYDGTKNTTLSSGKNPAISTGQGQQNLISALIQKNTFNFFVNNQYITSVSDNTYSQGAIGLWAASFSASSVDIAYQNLKVWNLP